VGKKDMSHSTIASDKALYNNPEEVQANLKVFVNNSSLGDSAKAEPLFDKQSS
jgi:hypothetical protein